MNDNIIEILLEKVKLLQNAIKIEELSKGYSPDKKFVVYFDNHKFLMRVGAIESYQKKKAEYQLLNQMIKFNVQSSQPIDIGMIDEFNYCYTIYSYIEGADAKEVIHTLTPKEQYRIGVEAGAQLSRMYLYKAPSTINTWYDRAMEKHYRYLDAYRNSGIKIENDEKISTFIEKNKHYLKHRPNFFQHDDYHLGNIIVKIKNLLVSLILIILIGEIHFTTL